MDTVTECHKCHVIVGSKIIPHRHTEISGNRLAQSPSWFAQNLEENVGKFNLNLQAIKMFVHVEKLIPSHLRRGHIYIYIRINDI